MTLPTQWNLVKLKDLVLNPKQDIVDGPFGSNLKASEYVDSGVPIIRLQNIERNRFVNKNIRYVTEEKAHELERHNFKSGDIVLTKLGNPLGKACIIPENFPNGIVVADVVRARINEKIINKDYLTYAINSHKVIEQLEPLIKGTTRPRVNLTHLRNIEIPLAPRNKQNQIVEKIEELFSQLDSGVAGLKRVQSVLQRYRASVLKAAVEGNLFKEQQSTSGIPEGWQSTAIKRIATNDKNSIKRGPFGSSVKKAYFVTEGYKIYQQRNVIDNDFSYGDYYIDSERFEKLKAFEIFPGDILITGAGTIGKFAVVPENIQPGIMNQALLKISLNPELIITDFFFYFFEVKAREYLLAKTRGSAMKNISSVRDLKEMEILLPPINEQTKIVEEVERQLTIINEINASIEKTQNFSSNISHSILKQAFQGKLL